MRRVLLAALTVGAVSVLETTELRAGQGINFPCPGCGADYSRATYEMYYKAVLFKDAAGWIFDVRDRMWHNPRNWNESRHPSSTACCIEGEWVPGDAANLDDAIEIERQNALRRKREREAVDNDKITDPDPVVIPPPDPRIAGLETEIQQLENSIKAMQKAEHPNFEEITRQQEILKLKRTELELRKNADLNRNTKTSWLDHNNRDRQSTITCGTCSWASASSGQWGGSGIRIDPTFLNIRSSKDKAASGFQTVSLGKPVRANEVTFTMPNTYANRTPNRQSDITGLGASRLPASAERTQKPTKVASVRTTKPTIKKGDNSSGNRGSTITRVPNISTINYGNIRTPTVTIRVPTVTVRTPTPTVTVRTPTVTVRTPSTITMRTPTPTVRTPSTITVRTPSTITSDIRAKRDIEVLGRLPNGLNVYRFRYLWSETVYVGVMAQEVLDVEPAAVSRGPNGFLQVDYAQAGADFLTWNEWKARQGSGLLDPQ